MSILEYSDVQKYYESPEELQQVQNTPWVKTIMENLQKELAKTVLCFAKIAMNLSTEKEDLDSWKEIFQGQFQEICEDLLSDMEQLKQSALEKIELSLKKIQELCKSLGTNMPTLENDKLSLYEVQHKLKQCISDLEHTLHLRQSELKNLLNQEKVLCKSLGIEPKILGEDPLPSKEDLKELQDHIEHLESEHFQRLEKYAVFREEILDLVDALKYKPANEFEIIVCDRDDKKEFCVSQENMHRLEQFRDMLVAEMKKLTDEIDWLWNEINHHWSILDIDLVEREIFKNKNQGISYEILNELRAELKHCAKLKKANLKIFVNRLREELNEVWTKCHCSEKEKSSFVYFNTDSYSEDLLVLHENEVKKWVSFYEENKELLLLLEKHNKLWSKMIELEDNATGPNRYNNRGGQLLKEEKERNKLSKLIPSIEEELIKMANDSKKPFRTFGLTVEEYIQNKHIERENSRKLKLSARKQQREIGITHGKSTISLMPQTCTTQLASASKRKLLTPIMNTEKKAKLTPRLALTEPKNSNRNIPRIVVNRLSTERKRRIEKVKKRNVLNRTRREKENRDGNQTLSTEYGDFKNVISARTDSRSTLNPLTVEVPAKVPITQTPSSKMSRLTPSKCITKSSGKTHNIHQTPGQLTRAKSSLKLIF